MFLWYHTCMHEIIQNEIMISYPDFIYDITSWYVSIWHHIIEIICMGYDFTKPSRYGVVTYDIIVSSMKSYPWHHSQAYHTCMHIKHMKTYYMKSWYRIQILYMISHCDILVYDIIYWNHMHGIWSHKTKTYDFRLPMIS